MYTCGCTGNGCTLVEVIIQSISINPPGANCQPKVHENCALKASQIGIPDGYDKKPTKGGGGAAGCMDKYEVME